jgi:hypothetical protein
MSRQLLGWLVTKLVTVGLELVSGHVDDFLAVDVDGLARL